MIFYKLSCRQCGKKKEAKEFRHPLMSYDNGRTCIVCEDGLYEVEEAENDFTTISEGEVEIWCRSDWSSNTYERSRLTRILNGDYSIDEARADIMSFRGS